MNRFVNSLSDESKIVRKRALESIRKETVDVNPPLDKDILQNLAEESLLRPILRNFSDSAEKCRELACDLIKDIVLQIPFPSKLLHYIIPVLVQRLGQDTIQEPSEEVRLPLLKLADLLLQLCRENCAPYLNDYVAILRHTVVDPFADMKRQSCTTISRLASTLKVVFHMQSETLINPLLTQISHQHSKVRSSVVKCIGDVCKYGNNKSVDDVVSHLAQRCFDPIPTVRRSLTEVVADWLLNLPDRYSYWHKFIPLLLTSFSDSQPEIAEFANDAWFRIGKQFEEENEQDFKDKLDFDTAPLNWYPSNVTRPRLGCRILIYRNFGRLTSGIYNDIGDWVVETRIKTAALLYYLILNVEDSVTQFMAKIMPSLTRGALDDERQVTNFVTRASQLIGYFVNPEVWCELLLPTVSQAQNCAALKVLSACVSCTEDHVLDAFLDKILDVVLDVQVRLVFQKSLYLRELLAFSDGVCLAMKKLEAQSQRTFTLFSIVLSCRGICVDAEIPPKADASLKLLADTCSISVDQLYSLHTATLLNSLKPSHTSWTLFSMEKLIFDSIILNQDVNIGDLAEIIFDLMSPSLEPEKDVELRLKTITLLCQMLLQTSDVSRQKLSLHCHTILKLILPNTIWKAGRVHCALRTAAATALWTVLESEMIQANEAATVSEDLLISLKGLLDDDPSRTRLVACKSIRILLEICGTQIEMDNLHKLVPDLLKRMDDSNDEIRVEVCKVFSALFRCIPKNYNVQLYRAHLDALYKGLLLHLDDPEPLIQQAVYDVIKDWSLLDPRMMAEEVNLVKHKHRTSKFCDQLLEALPI